MKLSKIRVRDPFILNHSNKYYLFGSLGDSWANNRGFYYHESSDFENWSEMQQCFSVPKNFWATKEFWAPEVHFYKDKFYMFATFASEKRMRATQILVSDNPEGPYEVWSEPITPENWMCLDGTLYVENGKPYMVFCHEWCQVGDGEILAVELSSDLKAPVGEPFLLIKASECAFSAAYPKENCYVTDGPFIHKTDSGKLLMLWSGFSEKGYMVSVAFSDNGSLHGKWKHSERLLSDSNGGHGMLFRDFENKLKFVMHKPNDPNGEERAVVLSVEETDESPYLKFFNI